MFKFALTTAFFPAYAINVAFKQALVLPFVPISWFLRKFFPSLVDDLSERSKKAKKSIRDKADRSIMTMSSLIAK